MSHISGHHSIETTIVHGTSTRHTTTRDLVPPIHMTSTFTFKDLEGGSGVFDGSREGYVYTRISNPTVDLLQEKIAVLEGGEDAVATASGMAAVAAVPMTLARPGDSITACSALYGGSFALFNEHLKNMGISTRFISPKSCNNRKIIEKQVDHTTRLLYMETPANPTLDIIDIRLWASIAAENGIPLVVDNTFASPYLQNPLEFGADVVVHSATKYLCGHGDIIGGVVVGTRDMISRIKMEYLHHFGPVMSPFNAWLVLRGVKTLAIRMDRHSQSALRIAQWLEHQPAVDKVYYPGLSGHPGHKLASRQMKQYSGIIAFELTGGMASGRSVLNSVKLCILAVSLGDCETLIQHPASMTHATYSPEERKKAGIGSGMIRLSVGLEDPDDIIHDLEQAFSRLN